MINQPSLDNSPKKPSHTRSALKALGLGFIMGTTALSPTIVNAQENRTETMNDEVEVIAAAKNAVERFVKEQGVDMPVFKANIVFRKGHPFFDKGINWLLEHGSEREGDVVDPKAIEYVVCLGSKPLKTGKDGEVEFDKEGDYGVVVLDANKQVLGIGD